MRTRGFLLTSFLLASLFVRSQIVTDRAPVQVGPVDTYQPKVGVVLSGGGASGLAHIGVLKALEDNHIPIDYICGTSMGALIGSLYTMGYTPLEIENLVKSDEFRSWATGIFQPDQVYYFKKKDDNASWVTFKLSLDTTFSTNLPTNLISPVQMDFALMETTAGASAAAHYDFDSLFIPFRCVASDVASKQSVVFKSGDLGLAVRASMAYPFYLKPVSVDGKLLFDGGLYNNFPSNVMYDDFFPDYIIGSNVASANVDPSEDNLLSQIRAMLTSKTDFDPKCESGIVIQPNADWIGLFDFDHPQAVIDSGYAAAMRKMDSIKFSFPMRSNPDTLAKRRAAFKAKEPKIVFDQVTIDGPGLKKRQVAYVSRLLRHKDQIVDIATLKPGYFRLASDDKIESIFPIAKYNPATGFYDLHLTIKKEKDMFAQLGGDFSNRPISTGFIGVQYNMLGNPSIAFNGNAYFGKLYQSAQLRARIDFPTKLPFYIEPVFTWNRLDYYKSSATYFVDTRPPYLIQIDRLGEVGLGIPVKNKGRLVISSGGAFVRYLYYQTSAFTSTDTADQTDLNVVTTHLLYERNTLNKKQFANKGTYFAVKVRFLQGEEYFQPGTTSGNLTAFRGLHSWLQFKTTYDTYFKQRGRWRLGFFGEIAIQTPLIIHGFSSPDYSEALFLHNYYSTMLAVPVFQPTPENQTLFNPRFRAYQYAAAGLKSIFVLAKNVDLRIEGYVFAPYQGITEDPSTHQAHLETPLMASSISYLGYSAIVWHSPLGPLSFNTSYFSSNEYPWSFMFNFGFIIFNRRALE
ncbi:MAG TPA: patatin-like phospholipase family protein [Bacteroidia bacterium]|jgi:NTE family protein|nr:patatin-like phospholipase family protein [Bacteroidia bacterium]